jgi:hypothetical protein
VLPPTSSSGRRQHRSSRPVMDGGWVPPSLRRGHARLHSNSNDGQLLPVSYLAPVTDGMQACYVQRLPATLVCVPLPPGAVKADGRGREDDGESPRPRPWTCSSRALELRVGPLTAPNSESKRPRLSLDFGAWLFGISPLAARARGNPTATHYSRPHKRVPTRPAGLLALCLWSGVAHAHTTRPARPGARTRAKQAR